MAGTFALAIFLALIWFACTEEDFIKELEDIDKEERSQK